MLSFEKLTNQYLKESPDNALARSWDDVDSVAFGVLFGVYYQYEQEVHQNLLRILGNASELTNVDHFKQTLKDNNIQYYGKITPNRLRRIAQLNVSQIDTTQCRKIFRLGGRYWNSNPYPLISLWTPKKRIRMKDVEIFKKGFESCIADQAIYKDLKDYYVEGIDTEYTTLDDLPKFNQYFYDQGVATRPPEQIKDLQQRQHTNPKAKKELLGTAAVGTGKSAETASKQGFNSIAAMNNMKNESLFEQKVKLVLESPDTVWYYKDDKAKSETRRGCGSATSVAFGVCRGVYFQGYIHSFHSTLFDCIYVL